MEQFELFSIDKFKCNSEATYYLNIIEGEWHPQDLNDSPLKFILSTSDDSDYICKYINTEHKQLTLYNKNNSSIVIEIFIPNDNKILL
ncbi:TPA: staphostatin A, partial [Staphylococcus aureus]|nr:staphostatin A [Staphylococcus aureus]HDP3195191.1 staphostatin A [Staphylococcus aureus]